ncbi:MAG TPA: hypothetical protein VJB14_12355, partial [Planctomycetota bacterium]|nr:hypothetical protein [Planctomycetota bacterium]
MRWIVLSILVALAAPVRSKALAFRDATVVVAPLLTLPKANVIVRDGLIVDVAPGAEIPPDAEIVDGTGLTVYAGFIDGRSTLGLPSDTKRPLESLRQAEGEKPDFTKEAPPTMEQANRKGLRPDFDTSAALNVSEAEAKKAHAGGFTIAVVALGDELLAGRAAIVTLTGGPKRNALLSGAGAMMGSFRTYGEGYPGTTMGTIAHLRQLFMDVRHARTLKDSYKPGAPRPAVDPAIEALQPVLAGEIPLFIEANSDRDILRAIRLAAEFQLTIGITGGAEAGRVADELHKRNIPVVLGLKLSKEAKPKEGEDVPDALRKERGRIREEEIDTALRLHEAKVRFCFSTQGLASSTEALGAIQT